MHYMKLTCALASAAFLVSAVSCNKNQKTGQTQMPKVPAIAMADLDTTVNPKDDFYRFANGGWIKNNPLKPAYSRYGSFDVLADSARARVRSIIEDLAAGEQEKGSNEYKIATLYTQAMDSVARNQLGAEPLMPTLKEIEALADKDAVALFAAKEDNRGESTLFGSGVGADAKNSSMNIMHLVERSLPLGDRDYYLVDNADNQKILSAYNDYIIKLATLCGYSAPDAERIAQNNMTVSKALAAMKYNKEQERDPQLNYKMVPVKEFAAAHNGFPWEKYLQARNLQTLEQWNVAQMSFFDKFSSWYKGVDLTQLKDFLLASAMDGAADYLSDDFSAAAFDFYGRTLSGKQEQKPRWERAVAAVQGALGEAVGKVYVGKYFPQEAKDRMLKLVDNLQQALKQRIQGLAWMSDETKQRGVEKLSTFRVKVGFPDKWRDYSSMQIDASKSYYQNMLAAAQYMYDDNMKDLGQPVDRDKWLMDPQTVNAYYMPNTNEICFPAGILQPPFFNLDADDAVNYGGIGVVIGHEMTHGFDDQGRQFDKDGNMNDWWTPEDAKLFKASADKLAEQFSKIEVLPGIFANGAYTLGENIADQGGLNVAFDAFKLATKGQTLEPIDGFTPEQRFFIGYARLWGQNITDQEKARLTKIDVHSLGEYRVNQALKNIAAFYEAFNIQPGDGMYIAPEERVTVW